MNHYNIPLIIYSGIDYAGKNIIFAVALVNDETEETRAWCFHQYFTLYKKLPNLIITDQDLALCAVLDKKYPNIIHLLCQWHIEQNLKKHFSFLLHMNLAELYRKIIFLPFLKKEEVFEKEYQEILQTLQKNKYSKSATYLQKVYTLNCIKKTAGVW